MPPTARHEIKLQRRQLLSGAIALCCTRLSTLSAAPVAHEDPEVTLALARRVFETLARFGEPVDAATLAEIDRLAASGELDAAAGRAVALLQARVLLIAAVNPEGQVGIAAGPAPAQLMQGGYRLFLARVDNPGLVPGKLTASSPESVPLNGLRPGRPNYASVVPGQEIATSPGDVAVRWLDLDVFDSAALPAELLPVTTDFKLLQLYARDAGRRTARVRIDVGAGRNDLGEHDALTVAFDVLPAHTVRLAVRDEDGAAVTCSLLVTDAVGRVYPSQTRRPLPDLYFQNKVYRAEGETLSLPSGEFRVVAGRGPEYLLETARLRVALQGETHWEFHLKRWIDPRRRGWYSGDTHIHGAGCSHYMQPTEGVGPDVMARQVNGEALSIGAVLTWGPGFYVQKRNFSGQDDPLSTPAMRMHYDLEVSGFPSSHCGHTVLLQMQGMDYPGTRKIEEWPSSNAPVLRWARAQGAITGYAHSGWGLVVASSDLPNEIMPAFDGIGANDFIVTAPAGLVDFLSVCDTPIAAELNIWYHTLNVGLRTRIAGETDWPCIFDEEVGMGRSYVHLDGPLTYDAWCRGVRQGQSYVSDGRSHLMDFMATCADRQTMLGGADLVLAEPRVVHLQVQAAARLEPAPTALTEALRKLGHEDKPYWHIERARIGDTRQVPIELIVDGYPVETRALEADGTIRHVGFSYTAATSCWIAVRIRGSSHTNPIWVTVGGAPIRLRRSAEWCRKAVDVCWAQKSLRIRAAERPEEAILYDAARAFYDRTIAESTA